MARFPLQIDLINGKRVELTEPEYDTFLTGEIIPNPTWRNSGLLEEEEVMRYLKGEATVADLHKIASYILIYQENLVLTAYLFSKSENQETADRSKGYNLPTLLKLRSLNALAVTDEIKSLAGIVAEMENLCMEVGADPL